MKNLKTLATIGLLLGCFTAVQGQTNIPVTWQLLYKSNPGGQTDVRTVVLDDQNAVYVGTAGAYYKSVDGGITWAMTYPMNGRGGHQGSLFDGTNVWLSGRDGGIIGSADRGNSWTNTGLVGFGCGAPSIEKIGGQVLLTIGGFLRSVYRWSGISWVIYRGINNDFSHVAGDDNSWVYLGAAGSPTEFSRTTNNGASWQTIFPGNGNIGYRPILVTSNKILIAQPGGLLYRSDSIVNPSFSRIATNVFGSAVTADITQLLHIKQWGVILASVANGVVYQSSDVGTTWSEAYAYGGANSFDTVFRFQDGKLYIATMDSGLHVLKAESTVRVVLLKAVKPAFSNLVPNAAYQLQISTNASAGYTNYGSPFSATNSSMVYPQCWDVDNWKDLFFRLQLVP